jgi:hypothetical protein
VVLTTTAMTPHEAEGFPRAVTTVDNVRAASAAVFELARLSQAKGGIHLELSEALDHDPVGDLVVIGGPKQNSIAQRLLERLQDVNPTMQLIFDDEDQHSARLRVGTLERGYDIRMQDSDPPRPKGDFAIAVMWINPFAARRHRLIWCAGFTSTGTYAAAEYLFNHVIASRFWRRCHADANDPPYRDSRLVPTVRGRWPCFILVLHVPFQGSRSLPPTELCLLPLQLPPGFPVPGRDA